MKKKETLLQTNIVPLEKTRKVHLLFSNFSGAATNGASAFVKEIKKRNRVAGMFLAMEGRFSLGSP